MQIIALRQFLAEQNNDKIAVGAATYMVRNYRNIKRRGYFALKDLQASRASNVSVETPIFSAQRKYGFLPAANFEEELVAVSQRIKHIKNLINQGHFHLPICSAKDQICDNCYFIRICRKEQLRLDKLYMQLDGKNVYKPKRRLEK